MKKFLTFGLIATAAAYYACLPFVVAEAGGNPDITAVNNLQMRVTAYASVPDETDSTPFITANGTYVHDGVAASNILPFGTRIQIPALFGKKVFTIEDRMSTHIKNTIDIWMPSVRQAIIFGANHTDIVVLGMPTSTPSLSLQ
jgi:3D (Asp-Asp-Asp) domain-containing protein